MTMRKSHKNEKIRLSMIDEGRIPRKSWNEDLDTRGFQKESDGRISNRKWTGSSIPR